MKGALSCIIINCFWTCMLCSISHSISAQEECLGALVPQVDINLEVGKDLEINCSINQSCHYPTESILWKYESENSSKDVDGKYITDKFQLYVPSVNVTDSGNYTCLMNTNNKTLVLGHYVVTVQYFPLTNLSLQCTSYNLEKLICTWLDANVPDDETVWTLEIIRNRKGKVCEPFGSLSEHTCSISGDEYPIYSFDKLFFRINVTNKVGNNSTNTTKHHFKIVIVGPPKIENIDTNARSAVVKWSRPKRNKKDNEMYTIILKEPNNFFEYMLTYKSGNDSVRDNKIDSVRVNKINLTNLEPNTLYVINITACLVYQNHSNKWGKSASLNFTTNAAIPDSWNALTVGSFRQDFLTQNKQDLIIYWRSLPKKNQNGDDFYYQISIEGENITKSVNVSSITLKGLQSDRNYTIVIKGVNAVGKSENASRIFVVGRNVNNSILPALPIMKDVVKFRNGSYQSYHIEWIVNDNASVVVFCCEVLKETFDVPNSCAEGINWYEIDSEQSAVVLTLDENKLYRFAVASFANNISQGLVWNSCEIPKSRDPIPVIEHIKPIPSTNYVNITWSLSCDTERFHDISGFRIFFNNETSVFIREVDACKNIQNSEVCNYMITNLSANTNYSIGVAIVNDSNIAGNYLAKTVITKSEKFPMNPDTDTVKTVVIVASAVSVILAIIVLLYAYKKCVTDRIRVLKHLQLPRGIIEKTDVIDCGIDKLDSSSVYTIKAEYDRLQHTTSSKSIYASSGFTNNNTVSLDSGLHDDNLRNSSDRISEDSAQEEAVLTSNYKRTTQSSDVNVVTDQSTNTETKKISPYMKLSLEDLGYNLRKADTYIDNKPDNFQSHGYTKVFPILTDDKIINQISGEKPRRVEPLKRSPSLGDIPASISQTSGIV